MNKTIQKILIVSFFIILQTIICAWADSSKKTDRPSYRFCPLGYNGDNVYYTISHVIAADNVGSPDILKVDFFKQTVDINNPLQINITDLPATLDCPDIKIDILKQYFSKTLFSFPFKWATEKDTANNKAHLFLTSPNIDKKASLLELPLNEYEQALGEHIELEELNFYLLEPHKFVFIFFIKTFISSQTTDQIPEVIIYSWDYFYNNLLFNVCALLNNIGMNLYKNKSYQQAYNYFLSAQHEKIPIAYYNTACMSALLNDIPGAIENLTKYADINTETWKEKVKKDKDFDKIRSDPAFKLFLENYE